MPEPSLALVNLPDLILEDPGLFQLRVPTGPCSDELTAPALTPRMPSYDLATLRVSHLLLFLQLTYQCFLLDSHLLYQPHRYPVDL